MKKLVLVLLLIRLITGSILPVMAENTTEPIQIVFHANGGEGTMEAMQTVDGRIIIPECTMTKTYFLFHSWNTRPDESGLSFKAGDELVTDALLNGQEPEAELWRAEGKITLYAQWISENAEDYQEYFIYYHPNGGKGETKDTFGYLAGFSALIALNEFTYGDYVFYHWNTKPDNSGQFYDPSTEIVFPEEGTSDITLYAIWWDPATGYLLPAFMLGDIDGNGQVAAADALLILQSVVGKVELTNAQQTAAKTSADDTIGAEDALCILQKVVGKIDRFPIEA
ncbi:MAG: InlB B-repeat-containing protein [Clostridia bacterium]|nr:InlB B-repeat-containing protein [Clostridia bacterium]